MQIPAAWFVAFVPHMHSTFYNIGNKTSPRTYMSALERDQTIDQAVSACPHLPFTHSHTEQTKDRFVCIKGAQQNGFENLGFFAAAVVARNLASLSSSTLNGLSAGYVTSRVVYTVIYINNTNPKLSNLRILLWLVGVTQCITLYVKAGNALKKEVREELGR
jgi:uncharacterized MAPEG superfamily protein